MHHSSHMAIFSLCVFTLSSLCACLYLQSVLSYKDTSHIGLGPILLNCDLVLTNLQWAYFQIRSHSEVLGLGLQHITFGDTVQPVTVAFSSFAIKGINIMKVIVYTFLCTCMIESSDSLRRGIVGSNDMYLKNFVTLC